MKKVPKLKPSFEKIKERTSRTSLTLVLAVFVFCILLAANMMNALGLWILTKVGVLVDGELELGMVLLFMTVISLVIGAAIGYFSSKIPLRPINNIINKMNRLAAGDFKARLSFNAPWRTHPVATEVTESFNKMAEELEKTELLRVDFINNFSHEFKTPIVSIAGFASLLESGDVTEEQRRAYLRSIREESMRLSSMATNMLNLTKVETQTILTDVSSFNLSEQIRSAFLLLEDKWSSRDVELRLDFDEYTVEANEELLKQVWINLIDNAIKFVVDGGFVGIDMREDKDSIYVTVKNSGDEIPKEKREKIFNKFYQADESHSAQGNGIGLAVVERIVKLHGGSVELDCFDGVVSFEVALPKKQR